jgi:hypothetical protein
MIPGLVFAKVNLVMSNCVFQDNIVDAFVGTTTNAFVVFAGCVIGFNCCLTTGNISLQTSDCIRTAVVIEQLCPFRSETPTISRTPTETKVPSEVPKKVVGVATVVGIAVGCFIAGSGAALAVTYLVLMGRTRDTSGWYSNDNRLTTASDTLSALPAPG